jgi:hypothetical protein
LQLCLSSDLQGAAVWSINECQLLHGVLHSSKAANRVYHSFCLSSEGGLSLQDRQFGRDSDFNSLLETSNECQLLHGVLHSAKAANRVYHSFCLSSEGGLSLQDGALVKILTSIHCWKPATSVSCCMGCCTPHDLPIVCGCAHQAKGASPCKMVLWSRSRLVGVCSDLFPLNKTKFNPTRQPAVILNHQFHVFVFVLISGSESSDG